MNRVHDAVRRLCAGMIVLAVATANADHHVFANDWVPPPPPAPSARDLWSAAARHQWEAPSDLRLFDLSNGVGGTAVRASDFRHSSDVFRMPAEFEHQRALLISCQAMYSSDAILDVVRVVQARIPIIALYCDEGECQTAVETLHNSRVSTGSIYFVHVPHNTRWTRDYGPIALAINRSHGVALLDTHYTEVNRPEDELVPVLLAQSARLPLVTADLRIDGGNMISNGQGLVITSTAVLAENPGFDHQTLTRYLKECYGASQVVFLEPLENESTGHVDMFATFTSASSVVVGQYDAHEDGTNAEVLDRNARRLAMVRLPTGRLKVRRIPMPTNADGIWRTYTNVVYVNGVLLMPVYSNSTVPSQQQAVATYRSLLPSWSIALINADDLIAEGGALHCAIMNLGPVSAERLGLRARSARQKPVAFNW